MYYRPPRTPTTRRRQNIGEQQNYQHKGRQSASKTGRRKKVASGKEDVDVLEEEEKEKKRRRREETKVNKVGTYERQEGRRAEEERK
jgi:hypothetical protein